MGVEGSRGWYNTEWDDNIEMEGVEEEEEDVVRTVLVGEGEENSSCPECREVFDQVYKEEEKEEEEGWYLNNAVRVRGEVYHPQCYRDKV